MKFLPDEKVQLNFSACLFALTDAVYIFYTSLL